MHIPFKIEKKTITQLEKLAHDLKLNLEDILLSAYLLCVDVYTYGNDIDRRQSLISYIKNFKNEVFKWIYKQPITNKNLLCKEFNDIIESKKINHLLINKDDETYQKIQIVANLFKMYSEQNNENNFMLFSKILDAEQTKRSNNALFKVKNNTYYQSQKEMLARTIERYGTNTLQELSNILSTPNFDEKTNKKIINIVNIWKNNIDQIILLREKNEVSDRIKKISKRFSAVRGMPHGGARNATGERRRPKKDGAGMIMPFS